MLFLNLLCDFKCLYTYVGFTLFYVCVPQNSYKMCFVTLQRLRITAPSKHVYSSVGPTGTVQARCSFGVVIG